MEAGLRRAVERDEFVLHYQPEYQADGRLSGFEALIRWDHPTLGRVAPSDFVPVAEECGLVVAMGRWALFEACEQAARWAALRGPGEPLMVSVNLSAIQLRSRNLVETVAAALARSRLDGECLCLEITESVIMEDAAAVVPMLDGLRALGVRLAIDDFGTGYSSLGYLSELPVDFIKIDRRFVEGIGVRSPSQNIVKAVIQLAHALDLQVVAEGIEQPRQLEWLRHHGCDLMQGFHLGRPGPAAQYDAIVAGSGGPSRAADQPLGGNQLSAV
jgi:EAL domain-containing protein (putative c-di-GMP-specific phosphodiesterase class I)